MNLNWSLLGMRNGGVIVGRNLDATQEASAAQFEDQLTTSHYLHRRDFYRGSAPSPSHSCREIFGQTWIMHDSATSYQVGPRP